MRFCLLIPVLYMKTDDIRQASFSRKRRLVFDDSRIPWDNFLYTLSGKSHCLSETRTYPLCNHTYYTLPSSFCYRFSLPFRPAPALMTIFSIHTFFSTLCISPGIICRIHLSSADVGACASFLTHL